MSGEAAEYSDYSCYCFRLRVIGYLLCGVSWLSADKSSNYRDSGPAVLHRGRSGRQSCFKLCHGRQNPDGSMMEIHHGVSRQAGRQGRTACAFTVSRSPRSAFPGMWKQSAGSAWPVDRTDRTVRACEA